MQSEWTIKSKDKKALKEHRTCFFCKRFFCTEYHHPRNRMLCSGVLPKWDFLYFLMREVKATDTCGKFVKNEMFTKKTKPHMFLSTIDKNHENMKDNYIADYEDREKWCKKCNCFGSVRGESRQLCANYFLHIKETSPFGHCDAFSKNKKINLLKYWLLKTQGFRFRNKVR